MGGREKFCGIRTREFTTATTKSSSNDTNLFLTHPILKCLSHLHSPSSRLPFSKGLPIQSSDCIHSPHANYMHSPQQQS